MNKFLCLSLHCPCPAVCKDLTDCYQYLQTREAEGGPKQIVYKPKKQKINASTKSRRQLVYERDGNVCLCCGESDIKKLTLDHILPKCLGGTNVMDNLQTLCKKCNSKKGSRIRDYRKLTK